MLEPTDENILLKLEILPGKCEEAESDVSSRLARVWRSLAEDPEIKERLGEVDPDVPPVTVAAPYSGFGVVETILISVAGGLARDVATWIWKEKIWPLLRKELSDEVVVKEE